MNCSDFAALRHDLLDDTLADAVAREAREHGDSCPSCKDGWRVLQRAREALREAGEQALPLAVGLRVMGRLLAAACQEPAAPPEIMTLSAVAEYLHVGEATVREALEEIPHFAVGGEVRIRRSSLERWMERQEERPAALGITGPVLTLVGGDAVPGALAG